MKNLAFAAVAATLCSTFLPSPARAGDGKTFKEVIVEAEESTKWWEASLSTGWDSLYMFRGVNILRNDQSYGSSLYWTDASLTFNLTENDFLTVGAWMAFGLNKTDYKELDAYILYTHTIGNLSLYAGYTLYAVLSDVTYSNELNVGVSYEFDLGFMTVTPAINYFFNVGPGLDNHGYAPEASSYLELRADGNVPLYKDILALAPWIAYGTNFRNNSNEDGNFFNGANNLEFGLGLPIKINDVISLNGYVAYSIAFNDLVSTRENTFWGGGSVTFSF